MVATEHDDRTTYATTIHRVSAAILSAALLATPAAAEQVTLAAPAAAEQVTLAAPAAAEQVTLAAPIQAGSLHDGPLDMVLYYLHYLPVAGGLLEVTGTYVPKEGGAARRFVMGLSEGDAVSFAMPGYPQATYRFARADGTVTAAVAVSGPPRVAEDRP